VSFRPWHRTQNESFAHLYEPRRNILSQIFQGITHALLHLAQRSMRCNLSCAIYYFFALKINNSEVTPSAFFQPSTPVTHWLVQSRIFSIPSVEGTWHEKFFSCPLDDGVCKNLSRVLAPLSSGPFNEVGKNRFTSLGSDINSRLIVTMATIVLEIHVSDCAELDIFSWRWCPFTVWITFGTFDFRSSKCWPIVFQFSKDSHCFRFVMIPKCCEIGDQRMVPFIPFLLEQCCVGSSRGNGFHIRSLRSKGSVRMYMHVGSRKIEMSHNRKSNKSEKILYLADT
jgi:hypothetical protein